MAVIVKNDKGEEITLYNPSEKAGKYCSDLHAKVDTVTGEKLTNTRLAFRSGYLKAREDSARAFCSKNGTKYQKGKKKGSIISKIFGPTRADFVPAPPSVKKKSKSKVK